MTVWIRVESFGGVKEQGQPNCDRTPQPAYSMVSRLEDSAHYRRIVIIYIISRCAQGQLAVELNQNLRCRAVDAREIATNDIARRRDHVIRSNAVRIVEEECCRRGSRRNSCNESVGDHDQVTGTVKGKGHGWLVSVGYLKFEGPVVVSPWTKGSFQADLGKSKCLIA